MMITFAVTLIFCLVAVGILLITQSSRRRVTVDSVILLIEWVLLGQAEENDWEVFCSLPILHDETLERIRQTCCDISENYPRVSSGSLYLLTQAGLEKLRPLLEELREYKRTLN